MAKVGEVHEGDKVTTNAEYDVNGTRLCSFVREKTYTVSQIGGSGLPDTRVVINEGSVVIAAVDISTLTVVNSKDSKGKKTKTERVKYKEYAMTSKGIEDGLQKLMEKSIDEEWSRYTTRLFGIPHQFQHYCDYRTFSYKDKRTGSRNKSEDVLLGRTFITNIMMEAPIVTFIPGRPVYLPAASDKQGVTRGMLNAVNSDLSTLTEALKQQSLHEKLRYYDFQQDYYNYIRYVNILCSTAAAFLDLGDKKLDGVPLTKYDWKDYRWTADKYTTAVGNLLTSSKKALSSAVDSLKTFGSKMLNFFNASDSKKANDTVVKAFDDVGDDDKTFIESLESQLSSMNYVEFFVDASSGLSESAENGTGESKFQGMMESASDMSKDIQFIINSGGVNADEYAKAMNEGIDVLTERMTGEDYSAIGGVMSRITSGVSNVISGETMIFPDIYQSSKFNKNYTIIVDLRTPYGNKFSFYMNILVPLFHIIAMTVPRQATANTYSSPFLLKAYYPGVFSCNLGIIQSIQIDKCPNGDGWTVDGFPSEVKVTINLVDLYSDLSITPSGDVVLFLANTSLIEFIATNCGINLVTPQLKNRAEKVLNTVKLSFSTIVEDTINMTVMQKAENLIASLVHI